MMRTLLPLLLLFSMLGGCASIESPLDDGYQPGDFTRTAYGGAGRLLVLQQAWCDGGDLIAKELLLLSARAVIPGYPEDGLCTDLIKTLSDARRDSPDPVD